MVVLFHVLDDFIFGMLVLLSAFLFAEFSVYLCSCYGTGLRLGRRP
jgi:hypothetical protein